MHIFKDYRLLSLTIFLLAMPALAVEKIDPLKELFKAIKGSVDSEDPIVSDPLSDFVVKAAQDEKELRENIDKEKGPYTLEAKQRIKSLEQLKKFFQDRNDLNNAISASLKSARSGDAAAGYVIDFDSDEEKKLPFVDGAYFVLKAESEDDKTKISYELQVDDKEDFIKALSEAPFNLKLDNVNEDYLIQYLSKVLDQEDWIELDGELDNDEKLELSGDALKDWNEKISDLSKETKEYLNEAVERIGSENDINTALQLAHDAEVKAHEKDEERLMILSELSLLAEEFNSDTKLKTSLEASCLHLLNERGYSKEDSALSGIRSLCNRYKSFRDHKAVASNSIDEAIKARTEALKKNHAAQQGASSVRSESASKEDGVHGPASRNLASKDKESSEALRSEQEKNAELERILSQQQQALVQAQIQAACEKIAVPPQNQGAIDVAETAEEFNEAWNKQRGAGIAAALAATGITSIEDVMVQRTDIQKQIKEETGFDENSKDGTQVETLNAFIKGNASRLRKLEIQRAKLESDLERLSLEGAIKHVKTEFVPGVNPPQTYMQYFGAEAVNALTSQGRAATEDAIAEFIAGNMKAVTGVNFINDFRKTLAKKFEVEKKDSELLAQRAVVAAARDLRDQRASFVRGVGGGGSRIAGVNEQRVKVSGDVRGAIRFASVDETPQQNPRTVVPGNIRRERANVGNGQASVPAGAGNLAAVQGLAPTVNDNLPRVVNMPPASNNGVISLGNGTGNPSLDFPGPFAPSAVDPFFGAAGTLPADPAFQTNPLLTPQPIQGQGVMPLPQETGTIGNGRNPAFVNGEQLHQ